RLFEEVSKSRVGGQHPRVVGAEAVTRAQVAGLVGLRSLATVDVLGRAGVVRAVRGLAFTAPLGPRPWRTLPRGSTRGGRGVRFCFEAVLESDYAVENQPLRSSLATTLRGITPEVAETLELIADLGIVVGHAWLDEPLADAQG